MAASFMLAGTVDDSYDRLVTFLRIGAKMAAFAFRIAEAVDRSWTSLSCHFE